LVVPVDDEKARGRARSLAVRREKAFAHAQTMLPAIAEARSQGVDTIRGLVDWLNSRDHKTARGRVWRIQTLSDLLHIDHGQIAQAECHREEKLRALRRKVGRINHLDRDIDAERSAREEIEAQFAADVARAKVLALALRGEKQSDIDAAKEKRRAIISGRAELFTLR
jgi:hypothetical protein